MGVPSARNHPQHKGLLPHHKLLCQFEVSKLQPLGVVSNGHATTCAVNGPSGEEAVDLVEDLFQLGTCKRRCGQEDFGRRWTWKGEKNAQTDSLICRGCNFPARNANSASAYRDGAR